MKGTTAILELVAFTPNRGFKTVFRGRWRRIYVKFQLVGRVTVDVGGLDGGDSERMRFVTVVV